MGATEVLITDVMEHRLEVAKSLGADHVYKVRKVQGSLGLDKEWLVDVQP